jgi:hypothetical protein
LVVVVGVALVWYTVWDRGAAGDGFGRGLERAWADRPAAGQAGRRHRIEQVVIADRPAVRLVDAPGDWAGWGAIPAVRIVAEREGGRGKGER